MSARRHDAHAKGRAILDGTIYAMPITARGTVRVDGSVWQYIRGPFWISAGPRLPLPSGGRIDTPETQAVVAAYLGRAGRMDAIRTAPAADIVKIHRMLVDELNEPRVPVMIFGRRFDGMALGMALLCANDTRLEFGRDDDVLLVRGPRTRFVLNRLDDGNAACELFADDPSGSATEDPRG